MERRDRGAFFFFIIIFFFFKIPGLDIIVLLDGLFSGFLDGGLFHPKSPFLGMVSRPFYGVVYLKGLNCV